MSPDKLIVVIVGGLSAGPSAATRARRLHPTARILLFEKGSDISYATCGMPYVLSGKIPSTDDLTIVSAEHLQTRFNIEVHLNEAVTDIQPDQKIVTTTQGTYAYDTLIFATGATAIVPPISEFSTTNNWSCVRTLTDIKSVASTLKAKPIQRIAVVGGGLIGCEMAENLVQAGYPVTLIEGGSEVLSPWGSEMGHFAGLILEENGIVLHRNRKLTSLQTQTDRITHLVLDNGHSIEADYVVLAIGVRPNTSLLVKAGANHLPNGALLVNNRMETSLSDIFAAGDCVAMDDQISHKPAYYPMGTHANKGGRTAGANAVGQKETYKGGYGTGIVQIFDYTFARTGAHPLSLQKENRPFQTTSIIAPDKPGYMPGADHLWLQVYFEPETGLLLGAEAVGKNGVDKRIDVLATALYAQLTVDDLCEIDFAYAPPYSPAKDPVTVAGHVAQNQRYNNYLALTPIELFNPVETGTVSVIDVRNPSETQQGILKNAHCIPLDTLDFADIPPASNYVLYCQKGLRGYLGTLKLKARGINNVANLAGGFEAWQRAGYPIFSLKNSQGHK